MDGESPCIRHQLASKYMIGIGNFCTPGLCMLGQETSERYNYQTKGWWCGLCAARSVTFLLSTVLRSSRLHIRQSSISVCLLRPVRVTFRHPFCYGPFLLSFAAWSVAVAGGLLLVYSDPKRFFKKSWDTRKLTKRWS